MSANRAPGTVWTIRKPGTQPNVGVWTCALDLIGIAKWADGPTESIYLTRKDARLLAKRINQCLDDTARK